MRTALLEELAEALLAQRFDAILIHPTSWLLRVPEFRSAYEFREAIFAPDDDLYRPVTGLGVRPDRVFVPRRDDASGGETKR